MKLRVNLLRSDEQRYQGPVSTRFLINVTAGTLATVFLLFGVFFLQRQLSLRRSLEWSRQEWTKVEPRFKVLRAKQADLGSRQKLLKDLKPWADTRVAWPARFADLQQMVPPSIQLTRLTVRSEWDFVKPPPPAKPPETAPPAEGAAPAPEAKPLPAIPGRRYNLAIAGRAAGEAADETVLQFANDLRANAGFRAQLFESIKLQRLVREANPRDVADRVFEIEGQSEIRKLE